MTGFRRHIWMGRLLGLLAMGFWPAWAQEQAQKPSEKPGEKSEAAPASEFPFLIQLLETQVRFEANGDSRKEVHTIVKINNALGARQFARITFDYNRSFQQVEISEVRIRHANGGTSEMLPSAVTDAPNPAVEKYPAYQDVRVKSVRILGLQEGDNLEYRVVTMTTHHPLAPDFWLEHSFDHSGQVLEEQYELDLPASRMQGLVGALPAPALKQDDRKIYRWSRSFSAAKSKAAPDEAVDSHIAADISLSTFEWLSLAIRLAEMMLPGSRPIAEVKTYEESMKEGTRKPEVAEEVREKARALTQDAKTDTERLRAIYDFVSAGIQTVDLPLGATGFKARAAVETLKSGYATAEDKYVLFAALTTALRLYTRPTLTGYCIQNAPAIPTEFKRLLVVGYVGQRAYWLDPSLEVAPFGMILRSSCKSALLLERGFFSMSSTGHEWVDIPQQLPFAAFQKVAVEAELDAQGQLSARVKYTMRGDNELTLREAFHQTAKEKWKDVATLLAVSDGFRGQVTRVEASDPMETNNPFTVEYEITQARFADWTKKPVRIPALLPQIGLPDPPAASVAKIELGTPLDVETHMTLKLPEGLTAQAPAGSSVQRDYATFSSKYDAKLNMITGSRHVHFLMREIGGDRGMDYNAFYRAVVNDQAQAFTVVPSAAPKRASQP